MSDTTKSNANTFQIVIDMLEALAPAEKVKVLRMIWAFYGGAPPKHAPESLTPTGPQSPHSRGFDNHKGLDESLDYGSNGDGNTRKR